MVVRGQIHVPCRLIPGESALGTHWIRGLMDPKVGLDAVEKKKILTCQESHPCHPASWYTDWAITSYWKRCLLYRIQINIRQYGLYQVILFSWMRVWSMSHVMRRKSTVLCTTWLILSRDHSVVLAERVSCTVLVLRSLFAGRRPYFGNGCEYEN
jgi:hypothetical protein